MTNRRSRASLAARLSLAVASTFTTLLLAELGVRAVAAYQGKGFFREQRLHSAFFLTYDDPPPRFDDAGRAWFRHARGPAERTPAPGVHRILTLGGSTTANDRAFARSGRDYAMALETRLDTARAPEDYEVLNAAADAFSTAHTLVNLQLRLIEYRPATVLLMHNINDLSASYFGTSLLPDYSNKYLQPFFVNPQLQAGMSWRGFLNQSRLLAAAGLVGRFPKDRERVDTDISEGLHLFRRNLDAIARTCASAGVQLVLLSQPSQSRKNEFYDLEHFARFNREIEDCAGEHGLLFVDMHTAFGHEQQYFVDEFHYSPEGIERFVALLAPALEPVLDKL